MSSGAACWPALPRRAGAEPVAGAEQEGRREGRGRLSSIEQLPEVCDDDIAWANEELRERRMPQTEILRQFNARLADKGIKGVSKGAFSRYSVRVAVEMRKLKATRAITDAVLERMPKGDRTDTTLAAIELVKFRIVQLVMDEDQPDPKLLGQAALTLQRLSTTALREAEGKRRSDKDERDAEAGKADAEKATPEAVETADAVEKIATEAGLSAERVAAIRRGVLGLAG